MFEFNDKNEIRIGEEWIGFRAAYPILGDETWRRAATQLELRNWEREMRFCPGCGEELPSGKPKVCPKCKSEYWPQLSPAVVVLVTRGENRDEALLVHARSFTTPFYALVAGFVEPGETLEECVSREVREETGLEIEEVRYFGSQSWPYPHQLMIAFTARLAPDSPLLSFPDGELSAGAFFDRRDTSALPPLPPPPSLTRRLIDTWLSNFI